MKLTDNLKKQPFSAPDGYFESFYIRLKNNIKDDKKVTNLSIKYLWPYISGAAVIIVGIFFIFNLGNDSTLDENGELLASEIAVYLENNIYNFDENLIIEELNEKDFSENFATNITDNEIIDYLVNEDISVLDIYETETY